MTVVRQRTNFWTPCRWTGQKAGGGGRVGAAGGKGGNKGNARRQDIMNLHMGIDQN